MHSPRFVATARAVGVVIVGVALAAAGLVAPVAAAGSGSSAAAAPASTSPGTTADSACVPAGSGADRIAPSGVFVLPDTLQTTTGDAAYGQSDWDALLASLHGDGFSNVIVQYTAKNTVQSDGTYRWSTFFPDTDGDGDVYSPALHQADHEAQLAEILAAAEHTGMTVTIGLGLDEDHWYGGGWEDPAFTTAEAATAVRAARAIWADYGQQYASTIAGWYLPYELQGSELGDATALAGAEGAYVDDYLRPVAAAAHALTPSGTVLVSPFTAADTQDPTSSTEQTRLANWTSVWTRVFTTTAVTRVALQDSRGAGSNSLTDVTRWTRAITTALAASGNTAASVWGNAETYRDEDTGVDEMPVAALSADLAALRAGGATGAVSFSAVQFDVVPGHAGASSPSRNAFVAAYREWQSAASCPTRSVSPPGGLTATLGDPSTGVGTIELTWTPATSTSTDPARQPDVSEILRDGRDIGEVPATTTMFTDHQVPAGTTPVYQVVTEDAWGIDSVPSAPASVTIPEVVSATPDDLAAGDPYAVTTTPLAVPSAAGLRADGAAAVASAPDARVADPETDGRLGSGDPTDPAWHGLQSDSPQNWTMTVPVTAGATIRQVDTEWLEDPVRGIAVPATVSATAVRADGTTVALGTVARTDLVAPGTTDQAVWADLTAKTELSDVTAIRVAVTAPAGTVASGEVEAFGSDGVDHAAGARTTITAATGTALPTTTTPGTVPGVLTDGSATRAAGWTAPSGVLYATVDLGADEPVRAARLDLLTTRDLGETTPTAFAARTAEPGGTWSAWGPSTSLQRQRTGRLDVTALLPTTTARFVQVRVTTHPGEVVSLREVRVDRAITADAAAAGTVTLPSAGACTAATCNATASTPSALRSLVTGTGTLPLSWWDAGTPWALTNVDDPAQPGTHGATFEVDLPAAASISAVSSTWLTDRGAWVMLPRQVTVEYRDPGGAWHGFGAAALAPALPQEIPAAPTTAVYEATSGAPVVATAIRVVAGDGSPYPWSAATWSAVGRITVN